MKYENSVGTMVSYGFGRFAAELFSLAFSTYCFFFYEQVVGLSTKLTAIGFIIYAIWNAVNDPLVGYLTNRVTRFANKWGKRFPYIIFAAIPWVFIYILIFTPPQVDPATGQGVLFAWLVIWSCVFDTFYSIWDVNYQAIFPDKFRSDQERRKAAGIGTMVGVIGIALGALVPSQIVDRAFPGTYITQGVVVAFIGFFAVLLMLPGVKETPDMIKRCLESETLKQREGKESFKKQFLDVLKNRNVMAFFLLYFLYLSLTTSMTGSIPYFVTFILEMPESIVTLVMAGFLVGALISIPMWMKISNKVNDNQKMILVGSVLLALFSAPLLFVSNLTLIIIVMVFWGTGLGLFWALMGPVFADAIDEVVVKTKKRDEGVYMGFRAFFGRLSHAVYALNIWIVHATTGWVDGSDVQTTTAIAGIRIHTALVPIILILIGAILFKWLNTLTPQKNFEIKEELKRLNL